MFRLKNDVDLKTWLGQFVSSKLSDFSRRSIEQLVDSWKEVVNNKEKYIAEWLIRTVYNNEY